MTGARSWRQRASRPAWVRPPDRERLRAFSRRSQQVLLLAGGTGVLVGLLVAGFDQLTEEVLLDNVLELPLAAQAVAPLVGLAMAMLTLRWIGGGVGPATADEYIRNFHDPTGRIDVRPAPARVAAAVATLGFGGSLGYEGPSVYAGAVVGSSIQRRLERFFSPDERKLLLVAGAAAGVAAIFRAPVTGLVFALEVPYQDDVARHMLLPAAIASAASYVTFAAFVGTEPLLPVAGQPPFDLVDLGGAALVGLTAGVFARMFVVVIAAAKRMAVGGRPWLRIAAAGSSLAALFALGHVLTGENLTLGPGYDTLRWALEPEHSVALIVAAATIRVAATAATVGGGGVGGLFIPLVIQGALIGRVASGLFDPASSTLFPVVGIASFLGAGYRVPLAAVVFVAEFTGRPGYIVPGLIAAVVAQLVMGRSSVSTYQVAGRAGHLERRLQMPLSAVVDTEARTVPPDATVEELFWQHFVGTRQTSVPVVVEGDYLGMAQADRLATIERDQWRTTTVADIMRTDLPVASPASPVGDALRTMYDAGSDRLAVCDGGLFIGVVTASDVVRLEDVLDRTQRTPPSL